jgi:hypothetical protein
MSVTIPSGVTVKIGNKTYKTGDAIDDDTAVKVGLSADTSKTSAKSTK